MRMMMMGTELYLLHAMQSWGCVISMNHVRAEDDRLLEEAAAGAVECVELHNRWPREGPTKFCTGSQLVFRGCKKDHFER